MARKESITIEYILDTAFAMTREEGFQNVTARKVAARAECSTQPIFRVYKSMEELWTAVYEKAVIFYRDFYLLYPKQSRVPFVDMGMAYIAFAREEKYLFELLFANDTEKHKSMYEILNAGGNVVKEISQASQAGYQNADEVFTRMWIFIHGAACMSLTGDYDLSEGDTRMMLEGVYASFE